MATIKCGVREFHEIPETLQHKVYNEILFKNLQLEMIKLKDLKDSKAVENEAEIIKFMHKKLNDFCGFQDMQKSESFVRRIKRIITGIFYHNGKQI